MNKKQRLSQLYTKVQKSTNSFFTVIPISIIKQFEIDKGTVLVWAQDEIYGIHVMPVEKS